MSKENNLTDFLTDVADAIREKKGTTEKINPQDFSDEIKSIKTSTSMWTGHVDVEGLKAIGWDDEDIAYFQEHGVNWMEEDDEYHKVSDDNKALYGVLTADNIQEYKDKIVYLPKIDVSQRTSVALLFDGLRNLLAVPVLELSTSIYSIQGMFNNCAGLRCVKIISSSISTLTSAFYNCVSLVTLSLNTSNKPITGSSSFYNCRNLQYLHHDTLSFTGNSNYAFHGCHAISRLPRIDVSNSTSINNIVEDCTSLFNIDIANLHLSITFKLSPFISKESILYMIEHEAATSAITISLHAAAYARLSTDLDIVEALENHPLVSLASA